MSLLFKNKNLDLKPMELVFHKDYVYNKKKRVIFTKGGLKLRPNKLELVHTYACGPTLL